MLKENPPGAIASMVCGIISIVLCWIPFVGLTCGIVAVVLASRAKRIVLADQEKYLPGGMRVAGLVCGIVGTVLSSIGTILIMTLLLFTQSASQTPRIYP